MALQTACQTPGAVFHTYIGKASVSVSIDLGHELALDEAAAALLEANIHNAMELVLAPFFNNRRST